MITYRVIVLFLNYFLFLPYNLVRSEETPNFEIELEYPEYYEIELEYTENYETPQFEIEVGRFRYQVRLFSY